MTALLLAPPLFAPILPLFFLLCMVRPARDFFSLAVAICFFSSLRFPLPNCPALSFFLHPYLFRALMSLNRDTFCNCPFFFLPKLLHIRRPNGVSCLQISTAQFGSACHKAAGLGYVTARCDYAVALGDCLFLAALVAFGLRWATEERRFASRATLRQRTPLKAEQPSAQELLVM